MGRKKKQEDKDKDSYIGRRVEKSFEGFGKYTGSVVAYNAARGFYKVVYDDGDREELEIHELEPILKHVENDTSASGKRGRSPEKEESEVSLPDLKRQKSDPSGKHITSGTRVRESGDSVCINRKRPLAQEQRNCDESDQDGGNIEGNAPCLEEDRKNGAVSQLVDKEELLSVRASKRRRHRQDQDLPASLQPAKSAFLSARGRSIQSQNLLQCFDDASDKDDTGDYLDESEADNDDKMSSSGGDFTTEILANAPEEPRLPPLVPLPPSSQSFPLSEDLVAEAFSVYSFLRSFSHALFLSPFTFDDFLNALIAERANHLMDSIHLIILQALRRHLQRLVKDDSGNAKKCLRQLDWNLLDNVTWPSFLIVFLATQGFCKSYGQRIESLQLLHTEYYKVSRKVKLAVLSFLCDHALETEEIRAVIDARELEFESQAGRKDVRSVNCKPSDVQAAPQLGAISEDGSKADVSYEASNSLTGIPKAVEEESHVDGNTDECVLCGMNGSLICCDGCPAAYHSRCVGIARASLPPGQWFCPECIVEKIGGQQSRRMEGLEGCHSLGVDAYGRTFMVTCGHLLVLSTSDTTGYVYNYYNKNDIQSVLQTLEMQASFCADIAHAISHYWDLPLPSPLLDRTITIFEGTGDGVSKKQPSNEDLDQAIAPLLHESKESGNKQHNAASCDLFLLDKTMSDASHGTPLQDTTASAANSPSKSNFMVDAPPDSTNAGEEFELALVEDAAVGQLSQKELFETGEQVQADLPEKLLSSALVPAQTQYTHLCSFEQDPFLAQKIVDRDMKGRFLTASSRELLPSESAHKLVPRETLHANHFVKINSYTNHYVFGDAAATAAANLALMSGDENEAPEKGARNLRKTGTTIAEQMSAFCKAPARFCWPSLRKKLMEAPKDRCGWCFSCLSCMKRGCLLNQAASQLAAGASRVSGGIRPGKHGHGHISTVVGYILHMEEVLQSFLVGPWENVLFRKQWRKKAEQAWSVCDVKASLLDLEANLRQVVLTEDWSKWLEDAPCITLGAPSTSFTDDSISKKASGKKSFRRAGAPRQGLPKSGNKSRGDLQWVRRGKVAHRVLGWATLATVLARKAGRRGGLKNIEGILYDNSEEVPRRTKQTAWRAKVQAASTVAELAIQLRCLDCLIRWEDLSSKPEVHATSKGPEEDVSEDNLSYGIHAKSVHDKMIMYLVDSKLVPRQSLRQNASSPALPQSCNSQQVWVEERQMPLHFLKGFEDKERMSKQSQAPRVASLQKYLTDTKRQCKKDVFKFLWERAGFSTPTKLVISITCKACGSKVLTGSAVQCHVCKDTFHGECTVTSQTIGKSEMKHTCRGCLKNLTPKRSTSLNSVKQELSVCSLKEGRENSLPAINPLNHQRKIFISQPRPQPLSKLAVKLPLKADTLGIRHGEDLSKEISQGSHMSGGKNVEKNLSEGVYWRKNGTHSRMRFEKNLLFPINGEDHLQEAPRCFVCKQQFKGELIFVKCEYCPLWFHGDAVGVKSNNLDEVLGFKCHKCRKKAVPSCPYGTSSRSQKRIVRSLPAVPGRSSLIQEPCITKRSPLPFPRVADNHAQQQMNLSAQKCTPTVSAEPGAIKPLIKNRPFVNSYPHLGLQPFQWQIPLRPSQDKYHLKVHSQPSPERLQQVTEPRTLPQILVEMQPPKNVHHAISLPSIQQGLEIEHSDQHLDGHAHIDCSSSDDAQDLSGGNDETQLQDDPKEDGLTNAESSAQPTLSFMQLLSSEDDRVEELAEVAMDFGAEGFDVFDIDTILGDLGSMEPLAKDVGQFTDFESSSSCNLNNARGDEGRQICGDARRHADLQCIGCGVNNHHLRLNTSQSGSGMWLSHGWACDGCKGRIL